MTDEAARADRRDEQVNDIYRALGRFVVAFSRLHLGIDVEIVNAIGGDKQRTWTLLAGERGSEVSRSWTTLRHLLDRQIADGPSEETERPMLRALHKEIKLEGGLIEQRNEILHDACFVGFGDEDTTDWSEAKRFSIRPGAKLREGTLTAAGLDALAVQCGEWRDALNQVAAMVTVGRDMSAGYLPFLWFNEAGFLRMRDQPHET